MAKNLDLSLAILNGVLGDYLARTHNGLATEMSLMQGGTPLATERAALAAAYPAAGPRAVLLVHGLMATEAFWEFPDGSSYGTRLSAELGLTPLWLRYNSGLAIADNGAALSALLTALCAAYPTPLSELVLLGHSMGGLVLRSACHAAALSGAPWLGRVRRAIYVGTPHQGAPLERIGKLAGRVLRAVDDPYTRLVAELADLRSAGVQDLGHADLRHEDRARRALELRDVEHPVPLLPAIEHYLIAGTVSVDPLLTQLFGDAIVPVKSATAAGQALPPEHVRVFPGKNHAELARDLEVYALIRQWCKEEA